MLSFILRRDARAKRETPFAATRETRRAVDVGTREAFWRRESGRGATFRGARATRREGFRKEEGGRFSCAFFCYDEINWASSGTASTLAKGTLTLFNSTANTYTGALVAARATREERERESRRDGEERGTAF